MKVRELRMAANYSQQELADSMNVDRSTVSCWERGTAFPRAEQLPRLADILHCTIDALFGREPA